MAQVRILCATALILTLGAATAGAQPPIGFERFTTAAVGSGVDFGLTETEVFQKYAAQLPLPGGPPPVHGQKDKRLIDIEIRSDGSGLANYVYDVVWVDNTDDFRLESWFIPDLTAREVGQLQAFRDAVIVDIERYPRGRQWRFSVILQRNPLMVPWQVMIDADLQDVMTAVSQTGSRLLDIDTKDDICNPNTPRGQACDKVVDAVFVENSGSNYAPTANGLILTTDLYPLIEAGGYQLIDHEPIGQDYFITIWVQSNLAFEDLYGQTENDVVVNHALLGRTVDLEVLEIPTSAGGSQMQYSSVHLLF